ncbi:family 16 glycosylhydrolase [Amycolatopsis sp. NPDC051371]|uniref:family 16 glycosylhydrolase n=1 Tax=Amycolatopsis sp. NPDC051371 TaxID=3155800 RepID=UPI00342F195B
MRGDGTGADDERRAPRVRAEHPVPLPGGERGVGAGAGHDANGPGGSTRSPDGAPLSTAFHTYGVEWQPNSVAWFLDGARYLTPDSRQHPRRRSLGSSTIPSSCS